MASVPLWRERLEATLASAPLHKEFCMATGSAHGNTPRVRHVSFQGYRSSGKVSDLQCHPQLELAWFIPPCQFRIRGRAVVIGEPSEFARASHRLPTAPNAADGSYEYWRATRDSIFSTLGPLAAKYDHAPERGAHVPPGVDNAHWNFVLVAIVPYRVEVLDLISKGTVTYVQTPDHKWLEERAAAIHLKERAHI